jgi:protein TonB
MLTKRKSKYPVIKLILLLISIMVGCKTSAPVEKHLQSPLVKPAKPKYPELAQRAGLEGTVWVKVLIDEKGTPKRAVVEKSSHEIFEEAAIEAAMNSLFTPAVTNNGPITCWVSIPYMFKLDNNEFK